MEESSYMAAPGLLPVKYMTLEYIGKVVAEKHDIKPEYISIRTRKREFLQPRQIAMYFSIRNTNKSLSKIGEYFGGHDHATVLHAKKTVSNLKDTDKQYRQLIENIEMSL